MAVTNITERVAKLERMIAWARSYGFEGFAQTADQHLRDLRTAERQVHEALAAIEKDITRAEAHRIGIR